MTQPQSHLQIHVRDFDGVAFPLAYPPEITLHDLKSVARNMLNIGKVREARVVDTSTGEALWLGQWVLTTTGEG